MRLIWLTPRGLQPSHSLRYHSHLPSSRPATPFAKPSSRLYVRHRRAGRTPQLHSDKPVSETANFTQHKLLSSLPISLPFPPIKRPHAGRLLPCPVSPGQASPARTRQDKGQAGPAGGCTVHAHPPPAWRRRRNAKGLGSTKNRTFFLSLIIITKIPLQDPLTLVPLFLRLALGFILRHVARGRTSRGARWVVPAHHL